MADASVLKKKTDTDPVVSDTLESTLNTLDKYLYSKFDVATPNDNELIYLSSLNHVLENGVSKPDRTGTGVLSTFGTQCVYDLRKGFPLLTTKKMPWNSIIQELWWFLKGCTNNQELTKEGVTIWNEWAREDGELGPIYGKMWRGFPCPDGGDVDQVENLIHDLIHDKYSRRILVDSWHPGLLPDSALSFSENVTKGNQALPPCHVLWQVNVELIPKLDRIALLPSADREGVKANRVTAESAFVRQQTPSHYLDLKLYQRSGDIFLGVPFNIASYSALLTALGYLTGYLPRYFIHSFGDLHLYSNHVDQARLQLSRSPKVPPKVFCGIKDLFAGSPDFFPAMDKLQALLDNNQIAMLLSGYESHDKISAPVSV